MHAEVTRFMTRYPSTEHLPDRERLAGVTLDQLARGAELIRQRKDPLRDSLVLEAAYRIWERESGPAFAIWQQMQDTLKSRLFESAYRMWVEPVEAIGIADETLVLAASPPIRTWVERRYLDVILEAIPTDRGICGVRFQ